MELKQERIGKFKVYYRNKSELKRIKREVFTVEEYKFNSENQKPFIIDCGSHIGLTIIYFKSIYPKSEILGFEPNIENFEILKINIKENNLQNVKVINAALSDREGEDFLRVSFKKKNPWTWGDTIINNMWGDEEDSKKVKVKTTKLSKYITKTVDFLKIDIEGSEQKVLEEIEGKLNLVKQIVMEFHNTPSSRKVNDLEKVKKILKRNNFGYEFSLKENQFLFPTFVKILRKTSRIFTIKAFKTN